MFLSHGLGPAGPPCILSDIQRSHTHTNFKAARCASPASMCCLAKYIGRLSFGRITIARFTYHCNRPKRGYTSTDDGWLPQPVLASETTADTLGSRGSAFAAVVASSYRSIFFKSLNCCDVVSNFFFAEVQILVVSPS